MEVLREQWMWNREARSIWLWVFLAAGVILAAIIYQFLGEMGLAVAPSAAGRWRERLRMVGRRHV
jgi:hypothetical protein